MATDSIRLIGNTFYRSLNRLLEEHGTQRAGHTRYIVLFSSALVAGLASQGQYGHLRLDSRPGVLCKRHCPKSDFPVRG